MEIPRGRGVSKAKIFKGKYMYEAKLEFPGGGKVQIKKPFVGGMDIKLQSY